MTLKLLIYTDYQIIILISELIIIIIIKFYVSELTDTLLAAQAFLFFVTGFEGSSTTMSHALYELAVNQEVQDKLREEIDEEYEIHDSDLDYENIKKMPYLNKVFKGMLSSNIDCDFLIYKNVFVKLIYDYFLHTQKPCENTHQ